MVNAQADDAVEWPDADYPFLIGDCEADTIAGAINKAEGMFGKPEWTDSPATMDAVRQAVDPKQITTQLERILETVAP